MATKIKLISDDNQYIYQRHCTSTSIDYQRLTHMTNLFHEEATLIVQPA